MGTGVARAGKDTPGACFGPCNCGWAKLASLPQSPHNDQNPFPVATMQSAINVNPLLVLATALLAVTTAARAEAPNIVLIVVDDLGYSDIGAYGGEIATPSLDALAGAGVQLTRFHSGPTCGPTRAMLMTGIDHHRAGVGTNAASLLRLPELRGRPGYEGYLNDRVVTVAELLQDAGYHTFMTGKWDLGKKPGQLPGDRGFDHAFGLADGGASHFEDGTGNFRPVRDADYFEDDRLIDKLPDGFYSTESYTSRMLDYLGHRPDDGRPFFAYVAYTAVHWPLQVPDEWLDRYKGRYASGWEVLRAERLARQKQLGIIGEETELAPPSNGYDDWTTLNPSRRVFEERRMEIYAAMTELLDHEIGRLVEAAKADGDRETIIVFLSDNGPEGNNIGGINDNDYWIPLTFDNRYDNMGRRDSYIWTGPGWGLASATPFSLYKSFVTEGGIRTPAIVYSIGNRFRQGLDNALVTVRDIAPTLLELAGVEHPGDRYEGRTVLPMDGVSVVDYLAGTAPAPHDGEALGWELYGNRALIVDEWKAILTWPPEGSGEWQLFNLAADPGEANDLAENSPRRLESMVSLWRGYAEQNGVYVLDADTGYGRFERQAP
jgi:arylsulfatase A-like enzyme